MHYKVFVPLFLLFANESCFANRYCWLNPQHTVCVNPPIGQFCHNFKEVIPTLFQRDEIVDWHNRIRQKIAHGSESRNSLPSASNMMKMVWDHELAKIAQSTANQCMFQLDCQKCRGVLEERFAVGQSIGYISQTNQNHFDFVNLIKTWYEAEVSLIPSSVVESYFPNDSWGHYSQVIWWNTRAVGCGGSSYKSPRQPGYYDFLVVCNYGPAANLPTAKIYSRGEKCSQCPEGTVCDKTYDGLCAVNEFEFNVLHKFPTDKMYMYIELLPDSTADL